MKVKIVNDGILIEPETEFEEDYLSSNFRDEITAFLKCGLTPKEIVGIKIKSNRTTDG